MMLLDLGIVLIYLIIIMLVALSGRLGKNVSSEAYFLSSRNLRWPSIAISTIATNVQGYQFLGMMGSAYLYGLAQANLEINAVQGLLMAAFIFVPLYLKEKVITITQFIQSRLGRDMGLAYSIANLILLSSVGLGAAMFWGAYAVEWVFSDLLSFIHSDRMMRVMILVVGFGIFSAVYTYFGGLNAVVKTDIIQFFILLGGGIVILIVSVNALGGFSELYARTPELMHLHLPADHPKLPWTAIGGMFLLNINYWCANQSVVQRSLAAKNLKEAQIGLMVGGLMKYFMAVIIIVPGIALAGILADAPLAEPDQSFPYLVSNYLPLGLRGLIICALLASMMSTLDSLFNSLATLWSIDIYQGLINPKASDNQLVAAGRNSILFTLLVGISMGLILVYAKFENPQEAFTHSLNELRYYINCGIVVIICAAAFFASPRPASSLFAFLLTIPLHLVFLQYFPEMNYMVRAMWVIMIGLAFIFLLQEKPGHLRPGREILLSSDNQIKQWAWGLLISLAMLHFIFH